MTRTEFIQKASIKILSNNVFQLKDGYPDVDKAVKETMRWADVIEEYIPFDHD